jgi:hypothetical protein
MFKILKLYVHCDQRKGFVLLFYLALQLNLFFVDVNLIQTVSPQKKTGMARHAKSKIEYKGVKEALLKDSLNPNFTTVFRLLHKLECLFRKLIGYEYRKVKVRKLQKNFKQLHKFLIHYKSVAHFKFDWKNKTSNNRYVKYTESVFAKNEKSAVIDINKNYKKSSKITLRCDL